MNQLLLEYTESPETTPWMQVSRPINSTYIGLRTHSRKDLDRSCIHNQRVPGSSVALLLIADGMIRT